MTRARPSRRQQRRRNPQQGKYLTPGGQVAKLVRSNFVGALSRSPADSGWGFSWTIADLPSYAEISNLYRRMRIDEIHLCFTLTAVATSATIVSYPVLYIAVDYSDASAPGSLSSIMERKHLKLPFNQAKTCHVVKLRPRLTDNNGVVYPRTFFPTSVSDTYYGAKWWIDDYNSTSANGRISLVETYHLSVSDEH